MDKTTDTLCEHTRIRLIAAAIGHQQCTATAGTEVLIPGTGKRILIGDDAYLAQMAVPAAAVPASGEGIYVASRASVPARPQMWQSLRAQGWPIVSTWIDEAGEGETGDLGELWQRIHDEIAVACGVILYAEESDFPLKGAYIECGMALGMGKPVAVVLKFPMMDRSMRPLGSWANHPLVKLCQSLDQARRYVQSGTRQTGATANTSVEKCHVPGCEGMPLCEAVCAELGHCSWRAQEGAAS